MSKRNDYKLSAIQYYLIQDKPQRIKYVEYSNVLHILK